jgi:hypothetical protein
VNWPDILLAFILHFLPIAWYFLANIQRFMKIHRLDGQKTGLARLFGLV